MSFEKGSAAFKLRVKLRLVKWNDAQSTNLADCPINKR